MLGDMGHLLNPCWSEVILIVYTQWPRLGALGLAGGGGPIMGDLWALKGLFDEG